MLKLNILEVNKIVALLGNYPYSEVNQLISYLKNETVGQVKDFTDEILVLEFDFPPEYLRTLLHYLSKAPYNVVVELIYKIEKQIG